LTLFVDASAFIAVIAGEPEQERFAVALRDEPDLLWSAMACWETVSGLRLSYGWAVAQARAEVELVVAQLPFRLVPIGEEERRVSLDAYVRLGKGSGHPARLNMGDCFAYACAKTNGAKLLYKGDDFAMTDLA
jgi:ribonuclease VapC